ncbi:TadE/TadG family type IV pilus assembly protein [Mesorhizobium sp. A623]
MSSHSKPAGVRQKAAPTGFLRRFLRDRSGSTAIEFVALAIPFSMLVFAILESCISFAGQEVMANATDDVARQFRTGQMRTTGLTAPQATDKVEKEICSRLEIMVAKGCPGLSVDLRKYDTFAEAAAAGFTINNGDIVLSGTGNAFTVSPGDSGTINMLRVFYKWPVMTDFMSTWMSNAGKGKTLHYASTTWQNEPFDN